MDPTALTEMVDRVLSDRYRIEELIGFGAISAVYSAFDLVENRWVACKVFDDAIANDQAFVERLLEAVEQAALLHHPNIASIYDWGFDHGPYVVSELCEGGSLAAVLASGRTFAPSQALVMALECARALDYGHEQGALHRNITPTNVLFSSDEHVRLSDYGLTAVLADAPASRAARALEGVRYASPEQARGRQVDESTDLYSLALVVNQAVSGRGPAVAETVVGTLMERAEAPAALDPSLEGLLPPLERCGRIDATERPEAGELAIALLATAETMPRPEALPLAGIGSDATQLAESELSVAGGSPAVALVHGAGFDSEAVVEPPIVLVAGPTAVEDVDLDIYSGGFADDVPAQVPAGVEVPVDPNPALGGLENLEEVEPVFASVAGVEVADQLDVPEPAARRRVSSAVYAEADDDADDRLPWWPLLVLGLLVVGAIAVSVYFFGIVSGPDSAQVPDLVGVPIDELESRVEGRDWQIERLENRLDGSTEGSIIAQSPSAGVDLEAGETLSVTVSLGNQMVEIPSDIIGLSVDQASSRLASVGLSVGRLAEENSEAFASGLVIGLDEPTTQKPAGQGVSLRVSLGPEDRIVPPSVIGMAIGDATSLLVGLRLQAVEETAYSPDAEVGTVLASIPASGEVVPADSAVVLIVSAGPEPVEMPDIIGFTLEDAIDELEALGLIWTDTEGTPGEDVIGSLPPIGAMAEVGTEVTIILGEPSEDEEDE